MSISSQKPKPIPSSPKLLDRVRQTLRRKHYSYRTEQAYVHWIKRFILFHHKRHPQEMSTPEIEAFLTYLAVHERVAASTQNQALQAILFLYREVLGQEITEPIHPLRAKKPKRLPTVLTRQEVLALLSSLSGTHQLMAPLLYGSGLRLMEC
ncbi:MAG: phage integrase N-terminal SAM-like domain-containing protein, partial [candidate division KSB1 bacterium]|nr:phage integrase N-terminal SAM-like domain-containing protein [candidate division KSB1 bacterium]